MCQLLETIKCSDGNLFHLEWHSARMNGARFETFGLLKEIDLAEQLIVPDNCKEGLFRCRVTYSKQIIKVEFVPHTYRKIESLRLVEDNSIDYHLKYANREALLQLFNKKEDCDDILIIKNGCITDSYVANVVFYDRKKWWTPDTPLLKGTTRERLLKEKKINLCRITLRDLSKFTELGLINAMQDLINMPVISIKEIKF